MTVEAAADVVPPDEAPDGGGDAAMEPRRPGQPRAVATTGPGPSAIPTTARSGTPRGRTTG